LPRCGESPRATRQSTAGKLREASGLKQSGIQGLSEREVRRLESGRHMPQYRSLERLAAAHGVSVEEYVAALAATA
jgi:hypothetical protein